MATIVKVNKRVHKSNLIDSDTGAECKTEKVVDITADCSEARGQGRVFLLFIRAKRGRIVQIVRSNPGEAFKGMRIHFLVDELEGEMHVASRDDTFGFWAWRLGLAKQEFRALIEANAPA